MSKENTEYPLDKTYGEPLPVHKTSNFEINNRRDSYLKLEARQVDILKRAVQHLQELSHLLSKNGETDASLESTTIADSIIHHFLLD
jgi:hypothetical protein